MDVGRLAAVSVFAFFMIMNILSVNREIKTLFPLDTAKALALANSLLIAGFYVLIISVYFFRTSARATTRSLTTKIIALFACVVPFIFAFFSGAAEAGAAMLTISNLLMVAGMVFALAALGTLGKSFSIIPQARKLVVGGPYRLVRHPVYLGEITGVLGLTLAGVSIAKILIFLLLVGCQVYRAIQEEKLLADSFPEYADYASKTARFIPGLY